MSRTPFDSFSKDLAVSTLSVAGHAEADARIDASPQFADTRFALDPTRAAERVRLGLLGDLADALALYEYAHATPRLDEVLACQRKQLAWYASLCHERRRAKRRPPPLPPPMNILCGGRPSRSLRVTRAVPLHALPTGCYGFGAGDAVRIVVIDELPRVPSTLLVRLMGRRQTFRDAVAELEALPADAWIRGIAAPLLVQLALQLQNDTSPESVELQMQTQQLFEELMSQQHDKGLSQGLSQGLSPLVRQCERKLKRPVTVAEREALSTRLTTLGAARVGDAVLDLDGDALAAWLADPAAR